MFGGSYFGSTYFAQAGGPSILGGGGVIPGLARTGIGGSGFPEDWLERMFSVVPRAQDEDVGALLALGLFPA